VAAAAEHLALPAPRSAGRRDDRVGYVFVAFFGIPFLTFNILPVLFGLFVGFTEWGIVGEPTWVGLDNFRRAFDDPSTIQAFRSVLLYGCIIVPGVIILGLSAALFVNQGWPLTALCQTMFFAPHVVSATVIGLIWVWILDTRYGVMNHYLMMLGAPQIRSLTSTHWSLIGVSIAAFAPVIGTHTQLENFGMGMATVTLLSIPSLALFLLLQKYFIQGITAGGVKG
jgi:multiple sugar transport system permease protein